MEEFETPWHMIIFFAMVSITFHASIHFAVLPTATKLWDWFDSTR